MTTAAIEIRNARTHNLKGIDLDVPRGEFTVFTGVSGSGKSSLVFATIHTEAQRQLIETFSSFARRRLPKLSRPPVDEIRNLATPVVIDQKRLGTTMRSTVGTATGVHEYLRVLYSRLGDPQIGASFLFSFNHPEGMCPECKGLGRTIKVDDSAMYDPSRSLANGAILHPDYKPGGYLWRQIAQSGLFDMDRPLREWSECELERLLRGEQTEVRHEVAGTSVATRFEGIVLRLERYYTGKAEDEAEEGEKTAYDRFLTYATCARCGGRRLNERARSVRLGGRMLDELCAMEIVDLREVLREVDGEVARPVIAKVESILGHLVEIGVGYLSLDRAVATLSGGESQRVKTARQLDCDLTDLIYILDEPTVGLHARDTERLIDLIRSLRDRGNSVLVVEHDPDVIAAADRVIDIGPRAGAAGGEVLFSGTPAERAVSRTPTGRSLASAPPLNESPRVALGSYPVRARGIRNLVDIAVDIPTGVLVCVTGPAGSGKSTPIHEVFVKERPEAVVVDQSPVGRSSRSVPLTYLRVFDKVRKEFGRASGADPALFSFNSKGACPKCRGAGTLEVEMSFLDAVRVECDACEGRRYSDEALAYRYCGLTIAELLETTVDQARDIFAAADVRRKLETLSEVGLGYLELGQPLSELSGGEAQRLKLAGELHKQGSLYVLDEPTVGLHRSDIDTLARVLDRLIERGASVVVIEHNLDLIARADWIVDMGPGGGKDGGRVMAIGTPLDVARNPESVTGPYLREYATRRSGVKVRR
ncbi:MAG: ATP-binding cassette domain-containing protein [Spirochaetota bacterium]